MLKQDTKLKIDNNKIKLAETQDDFCYRLAEILVKQVREENKQISKTPQD